MVGYSSWFANHAKKHKEIVDRLKDLSDDEVIEYFRFENMVEKEPDFCPLYAEGRKCHDMEILNCYFCGCPYFRFNDSGLEKKEQKIIKSRCSIEAKNSRFIEHEKIIHLDCSLCRVPHQESFIKKHFSRDWSKAMAEVNLL